MPAGDLLPGELCVLGRLPRKSQVLASPRASDLFLVLQVLVCGAWESSQMPVQKAEGCLWVCLSRPPGCQVLASVEEAPAAEGPQTRTRSGTLLRRSHAAPPAASRASKPRGLGAQPAQGAAAAAGVQSAQRPLPPAQGTASCQAQAVPAPVAHCAQAVALTDAARSRGGALPGAPPMVPAMKSATAQVGYCTCTALS